MSDRLGVALKSKIQMGHHQQTRFALGWTIMPGKIGTEERTEYDKLLQTTTYHTQSMEIKNILPLLGCLEPYIGGTRVRQLSRITQAMLAMTGRVTMLGISRWTGFGGSYRTIQRFFYTALPWATLLWVFFRKYLY